MLPIQLTILIMLEDVLLHQKVIFMGVIAKMDYSLIEINGFAHQVKYIIFSVFVE